MKSAMVIANELGWSRIPEQTLRRADQAEVIRNKRLYGDQDVAFGARPFILCRLPIRRLPKGCLTYRRRNGKFFLEVVGHPQWGVPFGQDRLVLLHMATLAVRHQSPVIHFRSGAEILVEWGMQTNGIHYKRLVDAFRRVFGSTMFFGTNEERREGKVWECTRVHFLDSMKLLANAGEPSTGNRNNNVTLSPAFWQELQEHRSLLMLRSSDFWPAIQVVSISTPGSPGDAIKQKGLSEGPFGLTSQLGVVDYQRERKFRERIRAWLKLVRLYWPECPAAVASNGAFLEIDTSFAISSGSTNGLARTGTERTRQGS